MKIIKKSLSVILVLTIIATTVFFTNILPVADALMYGMGNASNNTGSNSLYANSSDYVAFSYPTDIYMNVGETLQDVGYKIGVSGHYGSDSNYRILVCSNSWGGCMEKNLANDKTMLQKFSNYSYSTTTNGSSATSKENWSNDYCLWARDTNVFNETVFLQGTANNAVGDYTFTTGSNGYDVVVMQHYEYKLPKLQWITKYSLKNSAMTINIHIYDKAELNEAVKNAYSSKPNGASNWNEYLKVKTEAERVLKTREVTKDQVDKALNDLKNFKMEFDIADYSAVEAAIQRANELNPDNYSNFDIVTSAINEVVWYLPLAQQETVNGFALKINTAIFNLIGKGADYTKYNEAVQAAKSYNKNLYESNSWLELENALNKDVSNLDASKQDIVDNQTDLILQAIKNLVLKTADYSKLEAAINNVPQYNSSYYMQGSWLKYQYALNYAKSLDKSLDHTNQNKIDDATNSLVSAFNALQIKAADYSQVKKAIALCDTYVKTNYTNWSVVETAIEKVAYGYAITKQSQVDKMALDINNALKSLTYKGADYSEVFSAIAQANALEQSNYVDFSAVTNAINEVDYSKNLTQQVDVDIYTYKIRQAINNLVMKKADYSEVNRLINLANSLNENEYNDFSAVTNAIDNVVFNLTIDKQNQVNAMADNIQSAINSLVKIITINFSIMGSGEIISNDKVIDNKIKASVGEQITVTANNNENSTFLYWVNTSGKIVSYNKDLTFTAVNSGKYTAVFTSGEPSVYAVTFVGIDNTVLSVQYVNEGDDAVAPQLPQYSNYKFIGFKGVFTTVVDNIFVHAMYQKNIKEYSVNVENGINVNGIKLQSGKYAYNSKVVFTLDDYSTFAGWSYDGVNVISYDREFVTFVGSDINLTFIKKQPNEQISPKPNVFVTNTKVDEISDEPSKILVGILVQSYIPEGFELVSTGLIFSKEDVDLTLENAENNGNVYIKTSDSSQYNLTIKTGVDSTLNYRGFAVFNNLKTGETVVVYTLSGLIQL